MQPRVITIEDVKEHFSTRSNYTNTLIRDYAGNFYYVDSKDLGPEDEIDEGWGVWSWVETVSPDVVFDCREQYRIYDVPLSLAHFIIDALRLKMEVLNTGGDARSAEKQPLTAFIKPGISINGQISEDWEEIPVQLRPVIVEDL